MSEPLAPARPADTGLPIDNRRGAVWMAGAAVCFAITAVLIKVLARTFDPAQIVFFRCLFGLSVIFPFVVRHGLGIFRTARPGLHTLRVLSGAMGMNLGFYAMAHLPLATAICLGFTRPLFMIVIAVAFLGEVVRWRRGLATLVGFLGVLVVLGPTELGASGAAIAALGSAAFTAAAMAVVRQQAGTDGPGTIMAWFAAGTALVTAIPAAFVWQTPETLTQWGLLVACGTVASMGQYMMIRAFTHGEATVMNPIDYSQIILTAVFGYLLFEEIPTVWTWLGAAIIVASTLYILFREAALRRT